MGKIKSKMMRRTTQEFKNNKIKFTEEFDKNKKILGNTMPSKKIRNQIAGLLVRETKQENKNTLKISK